MSISLTVSDENMRLASLYRHAILDTPPEAAFDRIASLSARLFNAPIALINLVDKDRLWVKARGGACQGSIPAEVGRDDSFCTHALASPDIFVVENARLDPRFADIPAVSGELAIRFYAGAPLITSDGAALGTLCLLDFQPRSFAAAEQSALRDLAAGVVSELELRLSLAALAENERLYRQMFEDSPQPMLVYDVQTLEFLDVNAAALTAYGYSRAEFLSLSLLDIRPLQDRPILQNFLEQHTTVDTAVDNRGVWQHQTKSGTLLWAEITAHAIRFWERDACMVIAANVTERKAAEDALQRNLSMMQAQQEADPDGILVLDENHRIVTYNLRLQAMWALPDGLSTTDDNSRLLAHLEPLLLGTDQQSGDSAASPASVQYEVSLPDGRHFDCSSNPILSEDAHCYGRLWVFRDVTARKTTGDTLRRTLSVLKAQQEAALDGILVVDENRHIISYNQRLCELWNTPPEIIESGDDDKLLAYVLSLMKTPDEFLQRVVYLYEHPLESSREEIEMRDGRLVDRYSGPVISDEGKSHGRIWYFRDVTERRRTEKALLASQQRLALHIQQTPLAVIELQPDTTIINWNLGAEATFGYTAQEAVGQKIMALIVPEEGQPHIEQIRTGLLTRTGGNRSTNLNRTKSGEIILCDWYNTPLLDDTGEVIGVASMAMDITERKSLEQEREELLAQTESLLAEALERADRDPLTGLLNHRAFHKRLKEEMDNARLTGQGGAVLLVDIDNFKFFNDAHGHIAGDDVLRQVAQAFEATCGPQDTLARFGGDEFALLMPGAAPADARALADSLREAVSLVAYHPAGYEAAIPFTLSFGHASFPDEAGTRTDLLETVDARLRISKSGGGEDSYAYRVRHDLSQSVGGFTMLDALVTAVDNKDRYTRRHSEDVMRYCLEIAEEFGLDAGARHTIEIAALLHDVGKIGVPDAVLRKPGRLTEDEFEAIKLHPMMGSVIVGAVPGMEETLDAVRHHHERWDGEGYPFGLRGEETPLLARLMAVADAYSAMTTDRPYRKGMDPEKALRILEEGAGTQWDPQCVQAFLAARRAAIRLRRAA